MKHRHSNTVEAAETGGRAQHQQRVRPKNRAFLTRSLIGLLVLWCLVLGLGHTLPAPESEKGTAAKKSRARARAIREAVIVDCAAPLGPQTRQMGQAFLKANPKARFRLRVSDNDASVANLLRLRTQIALISRPVRENELRTARKRHIQIVEIRLDPASRGAVAAPPLYLYARRATLRGRPGVASFLQSDGQRAAVPGYTATVRHPGPVKAREQVAVTAHARNHRQ